MTPARAAAGRSVLRPTHVWPCPDCGKALGFSYPGCAACSRALDGLWLADWHALLAREAITPGSELEALLAQVVVAELDQHLWTVADMAMQRVLCAECGCELGGGPRACGACTLAFGNLWWHDFEAGQAGMMTMNEHALRVGRYVMRHPHRYSQAIATAWRWNMPRILTGWLPDGAEARRWATLRKAGAAVDWEATYRAIDAQINARADAAGP